VIVKQNEASRKPEKLDHVGAAAVPWAGLTAWQGLFRYGGLGPGQKVVRELGTDEVIDYRKQRFENEVRDVDMVFDLIGGETQERSWDILKKGGILVSTLALPPQGTTKGHEVRATRYTAEVSGRELGEIGALIDGEKVNPKISKTFSLSEAVSALTLVEEGHTRGKVVLKVL
jgi:NADPH:quinone reductase-like Zn-dependent oxidoreductase